MTTAIDTNTKTKTIKTKTAPASKKVAAPKTQSPKTIGEAVDQAAKKAATKKVAKKAPPAPIVAPAALKAEFQPAYNHVGPDLLTDPRVLAQPPAAPAPVVGVTVVETARASAEKVQRMVHEVLGIELDPSDQFFRTGTKMMAEGEDRLRQLRAEYEALPTVSEACASLIERIRAEQRQDFTYRLADLTLDRDGTLLHDPTGQRFLLSAAAMAGLENRAPRELVSRLRANFNLWRDKPARNPVVKIRSRNPMGEALAATRHAFGAVTESYATFDLDHIAAEVARLMPADAHAEIRYDGDRGEIDVTLAPTLEIEEMGVGQVHRIHAIISTADNGTERIRAKFAAERVRCVNCTTLWDENLMFSRMHVGAQLAELVKEALAKAAEAMEKFASLWREANLRSIVDKATGEPLSVTETFKRLIAHGYVKTGEAKAADLLSLLQQAYDKEPLGGAAGINAAITRLAHEHTWESAWTMQSLEDQAGQLLFAEVYSLPELTEAQEEKFAA